jgi:hypothetical protein
MEGNEKKFSWQQTGIIVVLVLLTAAVVGGVMWYIMDKNASDINNANSSTVNSLQNTVNNLQRKINTLDKSSSSSTTQSSTAYLDITELGIKVPLSSGLAGTTYKTSTSGDVLTADIIVPNSLCVPMATIFRGSATDNDPTTEGPGSTNALTFKANNAKQIGSYYYSFETGNGSTCFSNEQMEPGTAAGVQTQSVYTQLQTAFNNISALN